MSNELLARQLHAVIRHGTRRRRPDLVERAAHAIAELARAARITSRVWSDALASIGRPHDR